MVRYSHNIFLILIALLISATLNQDRILRTFHSDEKKHAVPIASNRSNLGDDYHYYVAANDSLQLGLTAKDKVYSPNNILFGSLAISGLINLLCYTIIPSSDFAVLISMILQTFLLVCAVAYVFKLLARAQNNSVLWVGLWTCLTLIFTNFFLLSSFTNSLYSGPLLSYYPNILRMVNPQIGWAYGLMYLSVLIRFACKETRFGFFFLSVLSLVFSYFSPALCLTMILALAVMLGWEGLQFKRFNHKYGILWLLLLLSFLMNYYHLHNFQISEKGMEIGTGTISGIIVKPHYLMYLILIGPLYVFYKRPSPQNFPDPARPDPFRRNIEEKVRHPEHSEGSPAAREMSRNVSNDECIGKKKLFILLSSVLISAVFIGMFCQTLHLGSRLWIRGAGIYVWIIIMVLMSNFLVRFVPTTRLLSAIGLLLCSIWIYFLLPHQFSSDYGYIKQDKWEILHWIHNNLPSGTVIMSDDLEFSFLLPIYTLAKPFVPLFSYSRLTTEETVKRYFYTLHQYPSGSRVYQYLRTFNRQRNVENISLAASGKELDDQRFTESAFYDYLIYYPYTEFSKAIFSSPEATRKFFSTLEQWNRKAKNNSFPPADYILIRTEENGNFSCRQAPVFQFSNYLLIPFDASCVHS